MIHLLDLMGCRARGRRVSCYGKHILLVAVTGEGVSVHFDGIN